MTKIEEVNFKNVLKNCYFGFKFRICDGQMRPMHYMHLVNHQCIGQIEQLRTTKVQHAFWPNGKTAQISVLQNLSFKIELKIS